MYNEWKYLGITRPINIQNIETIIKHTADQRNAFSKSEKMVAQTLESDRNIGGKSGTTTPPAPVQRSPKITYASSGGNTDMVELGEVNNKALV